MGFVRRVVTFFGVVAEMESLKVLFGARAVNIDDDFGFVQSVLCEQRGGCIFGDELAFLDLYAMIDSDNLTCDNTARQ